MDDLATISFDHSKFKQARERAGKTQDEIARAIGVQKAMVSKIECGMGLPSVLVLARFCVLTNTTISELIRCDACTA